MIIRRLRLSSVAIIAVLILLTSVLLLGISQAHLARSRAGQFLAVLEHIQVGTTRRDSVLEMVKPFRGYMAKAMNNDQLEIRFAFDNHGLVLLRLAPYTEFRAWIKFTDGVVVEKQARMFQAASGCGATVDEKVRSLEISGGIVPNEYPNHIVHGVPSSFSGITRHISIENNNTYAQRNTDWNFTLPCMTRFLGCADARLMLPDARPTRQQSDD
jgi:hypothetical protein